jgi:hypothetical protein
MRYSACLRCGLWNGRANANDRTNFVVVCCGQRPSILKLVLNSGWELQSGIDESVDVFMDGQSTTHGIRHLSEGLGLGFARTQLAAEVDLDVAHWRS